MSATKKRWMKRRNASARHRTLVAPDTYRVMCLVGLGHLDEARKLLAQLMASPGGLLVLPPKPPELASRALAQLQAAGWRPTIAAERAAG